MKSQFGSLMEQLFLLCILLPVLFMRCNKKTVVNKTTDCVSMAVVSREGAPPLQFYQSCTRLTMVRDTLTINAENLNHAFKACFSLKGKEVGKEVGGKVIMDHKEYRATFIIGMLEGTRIAIGYDAGSIFGNMFLDLENAKHETYY